jgi:hypothetical protein
MIRYVLSSREFNLLQYLTPHEVKQLVLQYKWTSWNDIILSVELSTINNIVDRVKFSFWK